MNKILPIYIVLFFTLTSVKVHAACSPHVGDATLNEIMRETGNNGDAFIEIKLLNQSVSSTTYDKWTIEICHTPKNGSSQCKDFSVAAMNDTSQWLWAEAPTFDKDFIDFKDGFDLSLLDENKQFIDYIQIDGYSGQNFTDSCSYADLDYVFTIPNNIEGGTKILLRQPDGTGDWKESKNLNEYPPTRGDTNDGDQAVHHFEIDTRDGQGLTCEADSIFIRACSDVSCDTLNHDQAVVELSVSDANNGVLLTKDVTVVGGEVEVKYIHTKAEVVSLSLDQTYQCSDGDAIPCNVTFSDAGFRFVSGDAGNMTFPIQLAGKPSNVGYNADTLKIEAVQTGTVSGACEPLLIGDPADVTVIDMAASYQTPTTGSEKVNISGTDIGTAVSGSAFDSLPFTGVTLDFRDLPQHSAEYIFTYPDAGAMQLHARFELPDDDGNPSGNFIKGSSNPVYVRPFAFDIFVDKNLATSDPDYIANPAATSGLPGSGSTPNNPIFTVAADEIRISTRAVAWKLGDDANANGLADQGENLTNNTTTANFTNVGLTSLSHTRVAPSAGVVGTLTVTNGDDFSSGSKVDTASYDEVGIISLRALKEDYLAAGINIEGNVPFVGRFIPSHFTVTSIVDGILTGTCSIADTTEIPFVYSGQMLSDDLTTGALTYLITPSAVIEARNKDDVLTQNYIDDFFKLSLTSFTRLTLPSSTILAPDTDATQMGKDTTNLVRLVANLNAASLVDSSGEVTYSYGNNDHFVFLHEENSEVNEFTSDIDLSMVSIIDSDTVETQDYDGDAANALILTLNPAGKLIRFGRAQLENSYGPETSNLPQPLSVNYFEDGQYKIAVNDECTPYNATEMSLTNIDLINFSLALPLPDITPVSGMFIDETPPGITRAIELTAPGAGNTGQVEVIYDISDWLKYDWAYDDETVDGLYNDNPRSIATFGIFRGNDRIIYQREIEKIN